MLKWSCVPALLFFVCAVVSLTLDAASAQQRGYIHYPAFDRPGGRVELAHDKGLIVEMVVRCRRGAGIVTFSRVEGLYCGPDHRCATSFRQAADRLCR